LKVSRCRETFYILWLFLATVGLLRWLYMRERDDGRFPDWATQEREQQELLRLNEVERFIQKKATQFAEGDLMLAEDLAQEGREAVIRRLREDPDCPAPAS